jgi:hypothetical protein
MFPADLLSDLSNDRLEFVRVCPHGVLPFLFLQIIPQDHYGQQSALYAMFTRLSYLWVVGYLILQISSYNSRLGVRA